MPPFNEILEGDCREELGELEPDSIDLIVTDPPYGYSFMGKEWDKAVVPVDTWKECLRVLKAGAFAFIMSAPRQDVLSRMIVNLQDAGFRTDFTSIYWTYASGFPKAANVSKLVDKRKGTTPDQSREFANYIKTKREESKVSLSEIDNYVCDGTTNYSWFEGRPAGQRLPKPEEYTKIKSILKLDNRFDEFIGEAEREIIKKGTAGLGKNNKPAHEGGYKEEYNITKSATEQAKKLDGSYAGFQPKPAVEVILTVMKPLSEKSFVDQALVNGKGVTWLDDCRIPFQNDNDVKNSLVGHITGEPKQGDVYMLTQKKSQEIIRSDYIPNEKGRFPANLLVEDDALNDGKIRKSGKFENHHVLDSKKTDNIYGEYERDVSTEMGKTYGDSGSYSRYFDLDKWAQFIITPKASPSERNGSIHPTMKPIKLMSYLITMGSRESDIVLDPFCGSGTTLVAAHLLNRKWIGIDNNPEYIEIARNRLAPHLTQQKLL